MRQFTYQFQTAEGTFEFTHRIGEPLAAEHIPHWATHDFAECLGCRSKGHDYCLAAAHLIEPLGLLDKLLSYDEVNVTVSTEERSYYKATNAQTVLSSLFGLMIATSGCPSFSFLKGLAHFHLPFATYEETLFRAVSAHFLLKYLHGETGGSPETIIPEVQAVYDELRAANLLISKRLKAAVKTGSDSPINALIILDSFGALVPMSVESDLEDLRELFL